MRSPGPSKKDLCEARAYDADLENVPHQSFLLKEPEMIPFGSPIMTNYYGHPIELTQKRPKIHSNSN